MKIGVNDWAVINGTPALKSEDIHIWQADLNISHSLQANFWKTLSFDEQVRANRFRFDRDRTHYIAAKGIVRELLANYLDWLPAAITFSYTEYQKPILKEINNLQFNISHSNGIGIFGFRHGIIPIGVDVEFLQPDIELKDLASQFFATKETKKLLSLPADRQVEGFFNCWTRKEAIIKAIGQGLSFPLNQFEVSLTPNEPAKLLATYWNQKAANNWYLATFIPKLNYIGALAIERKPHHIAHYIWNNYKK